MFSNGILLDICDSKISKIEYFKSKPSLVCFQNAQYLCTKETALFAKRAPSISSNHMIFHACRKMDKSQAPTPGAPVPWRSQ